MFERKRDAYCMYDVAIRRSASMRDNVTEKNLTAYWWYWKDGIFKKKSVGLQENNAKKAWNECLERLLQFKGKLKRKSLYPHQVLLDFLFTVVTVFISDGAVPSTKLRCTHRFLMCWTKRCFSACFR